MRNHLYQQLSSRFEQQIKTGSLQPGDKLPSVRSVSNQHNVSIPTVLQCYRNLENKRLIEARPKSGYYVSGHIELPQPKPPRLATTLPREDKVRIPQLLHEFLAAAQDPLMVPLGSAMASPELLPFKKLNRICASLMRNQADKPHRYSNRQGELELRSVIAKRLLNVDINCHPDELIITQGCSEAVALALQSLTSVGDAIAIESPSYQGHWFTLKTLGLKAVEVPVDSNHGMDLDSLEMLMQSGRIKCALLMSNFQNPLGFQLSEDRKRHIAKLANKYRVAVIEDDVFGDCSHNGTRPTTIQSYDVHGYILLCSSYSKTISPGYRIGWIRPGRYFNKLLDLKFGQGISAPALTQLTLAQYLEHGGFDAQLRRFRNNISQQTAKMRLAIHDYFPTQTRVSDPQGGYVLWVEPPNTGNSVELFENARKQNISVIPGSVFSGRNRFNHCLRINCGYPFTPKVEQAIKSLGGLLKNR